MKIAVGSDEQNHLTDSLVRRLIQGGHEVRLHGALGAGPDNWVDAAIAVADEVASGGADTGILCCWTGTGVSIAANKRPGIRAALCVDAETARGARRWNDANVLCLSLRATSETVAGEILDAWFDAGVDDSERQNLQKLAAIDVGVVLP
jgi:ribose 5-phosphate isomerase B